MAVWFDGMCDLDCDMDEVTKAAGSVGDYFTGITALMPGMTESELIEEGSDTVKIRTNEGIMERTAISVSVDEATASMEFDERYAAGKKVAFRSHLNHFFTETPKGVSLRIVISDVIAPGFLGLIYRMFASRSIGNAFLSANTIYFSRGTVAGVHPNGR